MANNEDGLIKVMYKLKGKSKDKLKDKYNRILKKCRSKRKKVSKFLKMLEVSLVE